ncbi:MAG: hypothetical protein J0I10_18890 [Verrucomicrobia bacterium]|nr:hypothetical protein [Verrucomicrobiota bacterium]
MPVLDILDLFIDDIPRSGPEQMALDEALFERASRPILRTYRWSEEWVTFGFSQSQSAVAKAVGETPCVRRWTGGGIVEHRGDFTFALIVPRMDAFAKIRPCESYRVIHRAMARALERAGKAVTLAGPVPAAAPGACFAGTPAEADLLGADGLKVCGGAQRRTQQGILHQGSLQQTDIPPGLSNALAFQLSDRVEEFVPQTDLNDRVTELISARYGSDAWNRRIL